MTPIEQLMNLMSEISERCWNAGWLMHTEFVLWKAVQEGPIHWGHGTITAEDIARLKQLADLTDGWIVWDDTDGKVFISMEQWLNIYFSTDH